MLSLDVLTQQMDLPRHTHLGTWLFYLNLFSEIGGGLISGFPSFFCEWPAQNKAMNYLPNRERALNNPISSLDEKLELPLHRRSLVTWCNNNNLKLSIYKINELQICSTW